MLSTKNATTLGVFALFIWSFSALFASQLKHVPTFEMLTIIFIVSALTVISKVWYFKEWYKFKQPFFLYVIGITGIYGNDLFYFEAFKHAPATHVDLINYLWPVMVVVFSKIFPSEKTTLNQVVGAFLSFAGIFLLIGDGHLISFSSKYLAGYGFAFADAVVWAIYVLALKHYNYKNEYSEVIGLYCLISSILSFSCSFLYEDFVKPSITELSYMIILGVFSQGLSYVLWELAIKRGDYKKLSNYAYFTPITSISVLVIFNQTSFRWNLIMASLFVVSGSILANYKNSHRMPSKIFIKLRGKYDTKKLSLLQR